MIGLTLRRLAGVVRCQNVVMPGSGKPRGGRLRFGSVGRLWSASARRRKCRNMEEGKNGPCTSLWAFIHFLARGGCDRNGLNGRANAQELAGTKTSDAALLSGNKAAIPEDKEYDVSGRVVSALVYHISL